MVVKLDFWQVLGIKASHHGIRREGNDAQQGAKV